MNQERITRNLERLKSFVSGRYGCGWMFDEIARMVYEHIVFYRPALVVHTGYLWGKSSLVILEALRDTAVWETGDTQQKGDKYFFDFTKAHAPALEAAPVLTAVDPNKHKLPIDKGVEFLKVEYGNFRFYHQTSADFFAENLETLRKEFAGRTCAAVIDGDHSESGCRADLESAMRLGCRLILVDDTIWIPRLGEVAEECALRGGYNFVNHAVYNGLAVLAKR